MSTQTQSAEGHIYKGWTCQTEPEEDGDGFTATLWFATHEDGTRQDLDWSRFKQFEARHFEIMIDHGFPHYYGGSWLPVSLINFAANAPKRSLAA